MSLAGNTIAELLTQSANNVRNTVAQYANLQEFGEGPTQSRFISDVGFFEDTAVNYIEPHPTHYIHLEERRTITKVELFPYGISDDLQRLKRRAPHNQIRTRFGNLTGVRALPTDSRYLVSAAMDNTTTAAAKTRTVVQTMARSTPGVSYHFLITRKGDITICLPLDDETSAKPDSQESSVTVGLECALAILRTEYQARNFNNIFELPYTDNQILTLNVLLNKLLVAIPGLNQTIVGQDQDGVSYQWPDINIPQLNFTDGAWAGNVFDYAKTDTVPFFQAVTQQGQYNLSTDIFIPSGRRPSPSNRELARVAIGQVDTVGEQSVILGNYASFAAYTRSNDMQSVLRSEIFVQRINSTHADADDQATEAGNTQEVTEAMSAVLPTVENPGPHTYNYNTGFWGDEKVY